MQVRGCQLNENGQHPCQKWPQVCKFDEKTGNISNIGLVYTFLQH